jgi:ribulose-phosphate 3-epimerase
VRPERGLAIKPGTPLKAQLETLKHDDTLLILSAEPGFGGQRLTPRPNEGAAG